MCDANDTKIKEIYKGESKVNQQTILLRYGKPLSSDWSRKQLIWHLIAQRQLQLHKLTEECYQILNKLQLGLVIV